MRKAFIYRLDAQVNRNALSPGKQATSHIKEENHLIRNIVDVDAIFEIWTFQTKPGNSLLLAFKRSDPRGAKVRALIVQQHREKTTEGKDQALFNLIQPYSI